MNNVIMMGTLEGDAQVIYTSAEGDKSLYKFVLRVPKPFKTKQGKKEDDLINVKVWSTAIEDEFILHDQAYLGVEGRVQSFQGKDYKNVVNDILANKVFYIQ